MTGLPGEKPGRLGSAGAQWALLLSALLVLGLLGAADFYADFRHHREQSLGALSSRAAFIETKVEHQLETLHLALGSLQAAIAAPVAAPGKTLAGQELRNRLAATLDSLHGVRTLNILDADGRVVMSNRPELVGANFAHRDYFSKPFARPDPARLYLSPLFRTILGVLTINVSRAIVTRDGRFAGVVTATLDPEFFIHLLQSGRSSDDIYALLTIDSDRSAFLGVPDHAAGWLQEVADQGETFDNQAGARETNGAALPIVAVHGEQRALAVRWAQIESMGPDNRIGILLSQSLAAIEQNGYHGAAFKAGLYGSVALISVFGLLLFQRRQQSDREKQAQQEHAVRSSEKFLREIADNLPALVSRWTSDLHCTFANRAYQEWYGRSPESMIGMRLQDLLGDDQFPRSESFIRCALRGEVQRFACTLRKVDGTTAHMWVQLIPDLDGDVVHGFLVLLSDVTEMQLANQALQAESAERQDALRELEQANAELAARSVQAEAASAAKSHFLSSVSHELRTPLHTILGYVRLLLKEADGEVRRQLLIVERSATQLLKLIDQLLEFNLGSNQGSCQESSQADEVQPEVVEVRELVAQLESTGHLLARERNNRFAVTLGDDLPAAVWVDEQRLLQVLQNLLGNACKYTRNGTVVLTLKRAEDTGQTVADGMCRLRFAVEDSGAGIAAEDQAHIFDAFNRGDSAHGQPGLGLGLAIARQWVRAMASDLQVHSAPGQGSQFFFTLELPTASARGDPPLSACEAFRTVLADHPRTVLVVDDIAENRLLLRDLCERWGFTVREASNGEQALRTCSTAVPPIAAALVDQLMPGMDGWELLRRIRQTPALEHLPTVLISASAGQKPAGFPADMVFDLALGKPLDEQGLACFLCQRLLPIDRTQQFCWLSPAPAASAADSALVVTLAAAELADFRNMLNLGRVVRIEEWALELAARDPAYQAFAERVKQHCRAADLAALEKVAASITTTVAATAVASGPDLPPSVS